jgi:MFS transporter, OFA family, oxalate/formate antiporter
VAGERKGLIVVLAGTGINLAFGVLYAWSIFGNYLSGTLGWTKAQASLPYTIAITMFALMMIPAGKLQDRIGPRWVATAGGVLTGLGLFLAGFFPSIPGLIICFGVLAGSGIGLGYASTTPAAVKWFPPERKGLITGIVVGGFGLASIYIAPLSNYLLDKFGAFDSFRILGVAFLFITVSLAQFVRNPPLKPGVNLYVKASRDMGSRQMLKTMYFWKLWFMFFAGATGGLMIIGHLSKIAALQLGGNVGFILVALAAIANAIGRPVAGVVSDKIGRGKTMGALYLLQGATLFFFPYLNSFATLLAGAMLVYFAYGSMLSVYPSACADAYGTKKLGQNYGVLFSAWGAGGVFGPLLGGFIADATGSYAFAMKIAAAILAAAALIAFSLKPYRPETKV